MSGVAHVAIFRFGVRSSDRLLHHSTHNFWLIPKAATHSGRSSAGWAQSWVHAAHLVLSGVLTKFTKKWGLKPRALSIGFCYNYSGWKSHGGGLLRLLEPESRAEICKILGSESQEKHS
jgi:hypothetical protein